MPGFLGKLPSKAQKLGPPSGTKQGERRGGETSKLEMADGLIQSEVRFIKFYVSSVSSDGGKDGVSGYPFNYF